jgi:hypothetical protein
LLRQQEQILQEPEEKGEHKFMPKIHNIGKQHFVQFFRLPVKWGAKIAVIGHTQEIEPPYRTSKPVMIRLPFYRVLVIGKWNGQLEEETALTTALEMRVLTDEDFQEGWTPAAYEIGEEGSLYLDS